MINLLPTTFTAEIRAGRTNVILIRYIFITVIAFAFLVLILAGSVILLDITKRSSDQLIEANAVAAAEYSATSAEIDRLKDNLNVSKSILNNQVSYSKVLQKITTAMPAGTVLQEILLNDADFDGTKPVAIKFYAVTNDAANLLGPALQAVPGFTKAEIDTISDTTGIPGYPISAVLTVTLSRSAGQ
jgi:capsular polysaccharide biosynthesis protein